MLFSSHILEEVEQVVRHDRGDGRRAARRLRRLPRDPAADDRAARTCSWSGIGDDRRARAALIGRPSTAAVELHRQGGLQVQASDFGAFSAGSSPVLAREHGIRLRELLPTDESLESVFAYLVAS